MNKIFFTFRFSLITYLLALQTATFAQQVTVINNDEQYFPLLNQQVLALEDAQHNIAIEQITTTPDSKFFVPNRYYTNFGVSQSAFWIKFKLLNQTGDDIYLRIINPVLDTADLFVFTDSKLIMQKSVLAQKPEMKVPDSPFLLPSDTDTLTCYIRVTANAPVFVASYILPRKHLTSFVLWQSSFDILFFGAILIMILYNLFLGVTTRNISYLYYVAYSFFLVVTTFFLKGYAVPLMGEYSFVLDEYFGIYPSLSSIFLAVFAKNFLQVKTQYLVGKKMLDLSIVLQILAIVVFLLGFVNANVLLYQIFNIYTSICVGWSAFYVYKRKNYQPALLFLIAFLVYLVLLMLVNLMFANLFPAFLVTLFFFHIGSAIELVLFSIALGNKINLYRKEMIKAQAETLELVKNQNIVLEQKVTERTEELRQTNEELNATLATVAKQHEHIVSSINYASRIQKAIIPKDGDLQQHFSDSFILFRPRDIVSGDFYWFAGNGNNVIVAAADCTGHGVPGAFMSMLGLSLLSEIARKHETQNAADILDQLRNLIKAALRQTGQRGEQQDGMDIALCIVNKETLQLQFAGAFNPLWIVRANDMQNIEEIKAERMPIGVFPKERPFVNHEVQLQHGDQFYVFSDGYESQFGNDKGDKLKARRMQEYIVSVAHLPMNQQQQALEQKFDQWRGEKWEQVDDVLLIGAKVIK